MQNKKAAEYNIKLDFASDAAIKGCALLLIEHSLTNENQLKTLVYLINAFILKNVSREDRKNIFMANFSLYIHAEIDKCLKAPKIDWNRARILGAYISELYKEGVVEKVLVKSWLIKLQSLAALGSKEAAMQLQTSFSSIADKFKVEYHREYLQFQQFCKNEIPNEIVKITGPPNFYPSLSIEMR